MGLSSREMINPDTLNLSPFYLFSCLLGSSSRLKGLHAELQSFIFQVLQDKSEIIRDFFFVNRIGLKHEICDLQDNEKEIIWIRV